jgi:hypothetical protein
MHPSFVRFTPAKQERAQETPGASRTRSLACEVEGAHERSHHRFSRIARRFLRNGFNGLWRALPGDRAFLSPSPARWMSIVTNLMPASRHQDHAISPSAAASLVVRKGQRPSHPASRFVTIAHTSLLPRRDGGAHAADLALNESKLFLRAGLDDPNHVEIACEIGF